MKNFSKKTWALQTLFWLDLKFYVLLYYFIFVFSFGFFITLYIMCIVYLLKNVCNKQLKVPALSIYYSDKRTICLDKIFIIILVHASSPWIKLLILRLEKNRPQPNYKSNQLYCLSKKTNKLLWYKGRALIFEFLSHNHF